jgi:hypothetical protein
MPDAGLSLRMDNGTQYTADDFLNPVKFWGIAPSFAFVAEPHTNGVAERFNRTFKEQTIHGLLFKNVEEVRAAVSAFRDRDNRHWRLENAVSAKPKTGLHVTPPSPSGSCHGKGGLSCKTVSRSSVPVHTRIDQSGPGKLKMVSSSKSLAKAHRVRMIGSGFHPALYSMHSPSRCAGAAGR